MACWDIVGKELGKPVYELLGGQVHERLRAYTYLYVKDGDPADVYTDPDLAAERAAEYARQGFTALKFDPVGPYSAFDPRQLSLEALDRAERYVKKIREAVGSQCDLLFGTHGQMTTSSAIRLAKRLEPFDPLWLEGPVPPENADEMARVARATSIPIATGERLATKYDFARLLGKQAASILQMELGRVGKPRRSPAWPRRTMPKSRRTCTAAQ
jgi:2-dehydro-3-deoxyphosphogalactonate aldolase